MQDRKKISSVMTALLLGGLLIVPMTGCSQLGEMCRQGREALQSGSYIWIGAPDFSGQGTAPTGGSPALSFDGAADTLDEIARDGEQALGEMGDAVEGVIGTNPVEDIPEYAPVEQGSRYTEPVPDGGGYYDGAVEEPGYPSEGAEAVSGGGYVPEEPVESEPEPEPEPAAEPAPEPVEAYSDPEPEPEPADWGEYGAGTSEPDNYYDASGDGSDDAGDDGAAAYAGGA